MKAAGYIRVSSKEQIKGSSLEDQENDIKAYCSNNGIELVEIFKDPGISGTIPGENRHGMGRLLQRALLNGFSYVIVRDIDRIGRETIEILRISKALRKVNIDLIDTQGTLLNGEGKGEIFIVSARASLAEEIKNDLVRKLYASRQNKAKRGGYAGGKVPYGYKTIREPGEQYTKLVIDESEAKVIRVMRSLRRTKVGLRNYSYEKKANYLN